MRAYKWLAMCRLEKVKVQGHHATQRSGLITQLWRSVIKFKCQSFPVHHYRDRCHEDTGFSISVHIWQLSFSHQSKCPTPPCNPFPSLSEQLQLGIFTCSSVLSSYDIHHRSGLTRSVMQKIWQLHLEITALPEHQAEAVQRLHFANNVVQIRMLGSI